LPLPYNMLRIISYNLLFGRKSKKIFPWLVKQKADLFCLQEFPEIKIEELLTLFPKKTYSYAFSPSMRIFKKIYGVLTIFRLNRLTLKKTTIINLGVNKTEKAILRSHLPRTALLTQFIYKRKRFVLVNPHLVNIASNVLRYQQIGLILKKLQKYHVPAFIIGDFNIPGFITKNKLLAFMRVHNFTTLEKRTSTYRLMFFRYQMDYAFARMGKIQNIIIDRRIRFSDHYPVTVNISL
jgi:endonuclease/exonuclease/phosphatase (EEP) superfamily protein YafD